MEQSHIDWVNKVQPIASGKTKLLSHWNGRLAIADPVGGSQSDYRAGFDLIVRESELWAQKIQQLGLC
jgi:protein-tyrosine phosphatase